MMKDGKLFGKFNIIDLLVVALLVAAALFLGLRAARLGSSAKTVNNSRIRYTVKFAPIDPTVFSNAKAKIDGGENQLVAGESFIDGYVVDFWSEPLVVSTVLDDGTYFQQDDPYYVTVYATVEASLTGAINNQVVSQEIRIGRGNTVKTLSVELYGTVSDVEYIN